ncbi:cellulose binding domain-containing protein [bacterium]|nr:cellulose binding domain-containing protein [bacterium]
MSLNKAIYFFVLVFCVPFVSTSLAQDVRILHTVDQNRDGRYTAHVMITNMTPVTINNWTMTFRLDSHVENIEHAGWSEFQDAFTVDGRGWTKEILPGDVVWFTISGLAYNGTVEFPRNCFFNGTACTIEGAPIPVVKTATPADMIVSAWIEDSDPTTYTGFIVVQNPTELSFPPLWDLKFSTASLIVEMEEVIWTRSGSDYQVYGHAHTDSIGPSDFALIPFRGVHTGTPSLPTNCRLNGAACTFSPPDYLTETPRLPVYMKFAEDSDTTWEGYIRIENPTHNELASWTLRFDLPMTITHMEGMTWTRSGNQYTVHPDFGRGRILEQSEYTFAMAGTWNGSIKEPENCSVNGMPCRLKIEVQQDVASDTTTTGGTTGGGSTGGGGTGGGSTVSCDTGTSTTSVLPYIEFRLLSGQVSSYIAFIDIKNIGTAAISGWSLEYKLIDGMGITSINSSTPVTWSLVGGIYKILPTAASNCILPDATLRLTVSGSHNGNFDKPIGCNWGGQICTIVLQQRTFSTDSEEEFTPVNEATLHSAYPNPFNPQSTISFEVEKTQQVRVELWDTLGRLRETLYSGNGYAGQQTRVQIDGSNLASGMYFVRLITESGSMQTQKVILQK